jgi:hypothetical protein
MLGLATCLLVAGCGAQAKQPTKIEVQDRDAERGRQAIAEYGCGACTRCIATRRSGRGANPLRLSQVQDRLVQCLGECNHFVSYM